MKYEKKYNHNKGIVLIIILMVVVAITIVGLGFIVRGDTELLCGQNMEMATDLSYLAESGLEHARGLIMYPQDLATENFGGVIGQQLTSGPDYYDVSVTKQSELNWAITSSAYRQINSKKTAQYSYSANLRLDPAIALWSRVGVLLNPPATITGDVYGVLPGSSSITGDWLIVSPVNVPVINCGLLISNFPTQTLSTGSLNSTTLSGASQLYYSDGFLEIKKNVIIQGGLVVDGDLTISDKGNVINAAKNVPAIYVSGNLIIKENAAIDCNGLVYVDGVIEAPISNRTLIINGMLIADEGMRRVAPDNSSVANNGIIYGDCMCTAGIIGGAINFDGNGDYIRIPSSAGLSITRKMSVAAFIKVNAFDKPSQAIVTKGNTSWRLQRYGSTNSVEFVCTGITNGSVHGVKNVNDGLWHHIAAVREDTLMSIYVDGILDGTQVINLADNINTNSAPVCIGENSESPGKYFNGLIDDVRVYNKNISVDEIWNIIDDMASVSGLVGRWTLDSGNCSTIIKASPSKAAIYDWPGGAKNRWSPVGGAFYKSITRNP